LSTEQLSAIGFIAKLDYENASPGSMLGHLEEINETGKSGGPRQLRRDVGQ
jgi:hypothetical protein